MSLPFNPSEYLKEALESRKEKQRIEKQDTHKQEHPHEDHKKPVVGGKRNLPMDPKINSPPKPTDLSKIPVVTHK
jgi:hypothetical protein